MARQPAVPNTTWMDQLGRARLSVQRLWRRMTQPVAQGDVTLSSSATINAQFWFSQFPLRPTAGWAVAAALLALGAPTLALPFTWQELALLLLLVDPIWGSVWRLAAGRLELLPLREQDVAHTVWLPYLEPGSPAARLLGWDDHGVMHLLMRVAVPSALLALAIALTLGPAAVGLTLLLLGLSLAGWIVRHAVGYVPAVLHSAATVALPWALGLAQAGLLPSDEFWTANLVLVTLWFVHNWGEGRLLRDHRDPLGITLLAIGDLGLAGLLIVARAPLWLALLSVIWMPTWLLIYQRRPLQRLNFWWLLAMLISGLALGQTL